MSCLPDDHEVIDVWTDASDSAIDKKISVMMRAGNTLYYGAADVPENWRAMLASKRDKHINYLEALAITAMLDKF